jgi:hypothetical protein
MNTPEQSPRYNRENAIVDGTLISGPSQAVPVPPPIPGSGRKHWHFGVLYLVIPFCALALIVDLLRGIPPSILRQEFEALGIVACALSYVGTFLRRVTHALAEDAKQALASDQLESVIAP